MLRFLFTILIFIILSFSAHAQYTVGETENIARHDVERNRMKQIPRNPKAGLEYDVKYLKFNLQVDPAVKYIKGNVLQQLVLHESKPGYIQFELSDSLSVDSILFSGVYPDWVRPGNDILQIFLPHPKAEGGQDTLNIYYQGVPPEGNGFGSFKQNYHLDAPIIWTLSQPYGCSDWWPCKNDLADKVDSVDMWVRTTFPNRVASVGLLTDSVRNGNFVTYKWKHRYPVAPYLIAFAVTNYTSFTDYVVTGNDSLMVLNYVYPENMPDIREQAKGIIPIIELFTDLFIPYPFSEEKYGHAQFGMGGGMEHQTMSFMGNLGHELMAHEAAHMWFGDYITTGTWKEIWLNEGFATYCTGLTYENMFNGYYWNIWKSNTRGAITREPGGSVYVADTSDVMRVFDARLSYHKGAFLLHMLRWKIGDVAFFKGLKNYLNDPELAFGYATTAQFKNHMEAVSEQDLTGFFEDWLYGEGYPSYHMICSQKEPGKFKVTLSQTPSHPSVDFFEMPVPVKFSSATRDTLIVFDHQFNNQEYIIDLDFLPDSILVDPDIWLVSGGNTYTLGMDDLVKNKNFRISPNPFSDVIRIESLINDYLSIELLDLSGKQLWSGLFRAMPGELITIPAGDVKSGYYVIKITGADRTHYQKTVKL